MLVETYMAKEGQIGTPWYRLYRNDGTKEKYQQVLLIGDFNVKIGKHIPGNKDTISKGGRQLKIIIEKCNLNIINANEIKYQGKWTRVQGEEKSIIDCYYQSRIHGNH